jgi:Methyltransferase FkbM domain
VELLKMDIEGAETEVIEELAESGKLKFIKQMILEYHHHLNPEEDHLCRVLCALERSGFGYQISSMSAAPFVPKLVQPMLIYAYQRS